MLALPLSRHLIQHNKIVRECSRIYIVLRTPINPEFQMHDIVLDNEIDKKLYNPRYECMVIYHVSCYSIIMI